MIDVSEDTHVDKADAWGRNARKNYEIARLRASLSDAADALEHANDLLGPNTNQIIGREAALVRARKAL